VVPLGVGSAQAASASGAPRAQAGNASADASTVNVIIRRMLAPSPDRRPEC
jgi:hypothetical protein